MDSREMQSLHDRWSSYNQLETLTEHWYWRPGWAAERRFYTWHIVFDNQTSVHDLVREVQGQIGLEGLDPVPIEGLHLTMQGLGFVDEISNADVSAIVNAAKARLERLTLFPLKIGPVDPDAEGVGLLVSPWLPVENIRTSLRQAIAEVWGDAPEPTDGFRPHVTVAYSGGSVPVEPIRRALLPLRNLAPAVAIISQVSLIALRREEREYRWDTISTVHLSRSS